MSATPHAGVLAEFYVPDAALSAARQVRAAGWTHFDFLTPFPVHGMEDAMGQTRSWIPWATGALAVCGILFAQGLQNYVMVWDWPMNFGGKPHVAWPSFVPITFEAMVFCAALGTAAIAIIAGKRDTVPQPPPGATGATVDRFVLWISATDPKWDDVEAARFAASIGGDAVRLVSPEGAAHAG